MTTNPQHFNSIVISELYNENIHGIDETTDPDIHFHYIVAERFTAEEFYLYNKKGDEDYRDGEIINTLIMYKRALRYRMRSAFLCAGNTSIRNYKHIISQKRYIQLDIGLCIYLRGQEMVCIKKTFWLKIIQRTWKRVCLERKNIAKRATLFVLYQREIKKIYSPLPRLKGMLSYLKHN